jgi:hypothetical protein
VAVSAGGEAYGEIALRHRRFTQGAFGGLVQHRDKTADDFEVAELLGCDVQKQCIAGVCCA